jgi:transcriptional regulator with XRE-family HTH domain
MGPATKRIEDYGLDRILERIESGQSQSEIAKNLEVSIGLLNGWLHATPERSARAQIVMQASAESWLDRGLQALTDAASDNAEIQRARAIEQHCARRAAVRNPLYRDKVDLSLSRKPGDFTELTTAELTELVRQQQQQIGNDP